MHYNSRYLPFCSIVFIFEKNYENYSCRFTWEEKSTKMPRTQFERYKEYLHLNICLHLQCLQISARDLYTFFFK